MKMILRNVFVLIVLLISESFAQDSSKVWNILTIPSYESNQYLYMFVQNDTLRIETNATVDSAAQVIFESMKAKFSLEMAKYMELQRAYCQMRDYLAYYVMLARARKNPEDKETMFALAKMHLDTPACDCGTEK